MRRTVNWDKIWRADEKQCKHLQIFIELYWICKKSTKINANNFKEFGIKKEIWDVWNRNLTIRETAAFLAELRVFRLHRKRNIQKVFRDNVWEAKFIDEKFLETHSQFDLFDLNTIFTDMNNRTTIKHLKKDTIIHSFDLNELFSDLALKPEDYFCCESKSPWPAVFKISCKKCFMCRVESDDLLNAMLKVRL